MVNGVAELTLGVVRPGCKGCGFSFVDQQLVCRRYPPQVTILIAPNPPPRTGIGPQVLAAYPIVNADMWCGEWRSGSLGPQQG